MFDIGTALNVASTGGKALGSLLDGASGVMALLPKSKSFSINGKQVVKSKNRDGNISTNYNMSDDEESLLNYANSNLLKGLQDINVFSDEVQKNIQNQVNAYKSQGIKNINSTYTPMFRDLRNDIAARFGNLDNSVFMDNLNNIEQNRASAIEDLTQNILSKQAELYEQEMNYRYNYLNQLSAVKGDVNSNILSFLKMAAGN